MRISKKEILKYGIQKQGESIHDNNIFFIWLCDLAHLSWLVCLRKKRSIFFIGRKKKKNEVRTFESPRLLNHLKKDNDQDSLSKEHLLKWLTYSTNPAFWKPIPSSISQRECYLVSSFFFILIVPFLIFVSTFLFKMGMDIFLSDLILKRVS